MLQKLAIMFENGSKAAKVVGLTDTDTSGTEYHKSGRATHFRLLYTLSGTPPTTLRATLLGTPDGGTTDYPEPAINVISGGVSETDDHVMDLPVTAGEHSGPRIPIDPGIQYKVTFIRTGGDGTTSVLAKGLFTRPGGGPL